jgi:hypothetical protein
MRIVYTHIFFFFSLSSSSSPSSSRRRSRQWQNRRAFSVSQFCRDENMSFPMRAEISMQLKRDLLSNPLFRTLS